MAYLERSGGKKEVLTISVGDNESAKYWLSIMNELKNSGVKDVLIICADGLIGLLYQKSGSNNSKTLQKQGFVYNLIFTISNSEYFSYARITQKCILLFIFTYTIQKIK